MEVWLKAVNFISTYFFALTINLGYLITAKMVLRAKGFKLHWHLFLCPNNCLDSGSGSRVDDVIPVPQTSGRKFHVSFDEEDAGVADLTAAFLDQAEALLEEWLVPLAVSEARAEMIQKAWKLFEMKLATDTGP